MLRQCNILIRERDRQSRLRLLWLRVEAERVARAHRLAVGRVMMVKKR